MTLDQLQIFIAVAEREHVTRAADALGLAPPSVSAAVASLEREFGTKLFHRVGRGIVVTEGGKLLLDEARALVNRADSVKLAMREFTGLARGRLQIKASQTIASHFLPPRLVDFHQAHPGVALVVSIGNSTEVAEAIVRGTVELGFIEGPEEDFQDPRLAVEMIAQDDLVMVAVRVRADRGVSRSHRSSWATPRPEGGREGPSPFCYQGEGPGTPQAAGRARRGDHAVPPPDDRSRALA